jgi:glycosyltransferase involved in cell wall biosynthesis
MRRVRPSAAPSPLRVAYVTNAHGVGGAERIVLALLRGGREREWAQLVLNPFATDRSAALAESCAPTAYRARPAQRVTQLPALRRWLARELAAFEPDLVHVSLFQATALTATLRLGRTATVLTHAYGEGVRARARAGLAERLDRWASRRYDAVVAISESVQRFVVDDLGVPAARVQLIRPGWEGNPVARSTEPRPPTAICVAKFRPEKGHALLLDAFAQVLERVPDARLVLVGDGELADPMARRAQDLGISGQVRFAGAVESIWPELARADVFVLASTTEAAGIAIMEAMAAGLPVVAPAVGGIPELVTPGRNGELCRPGDRADMARALGALLGDSDARAAMSGHAVADASQWHMDATVERYFSVYERLRDGRPR